VTRGLNDAIALLKQAEIRLDNPLKKLLGRRPISMSELLAQKLGK
jgi:hypothetical protein